MAELLGGLPRQQGMGGPMHFADIHKHFWGGYAIVGGHLPLAGHRLMISTAAARRGACYDDGATNIGYFESLNLAAV
jgi:pyruvate dehydrogenase E1 component alpha subunit